MTIRVPIESLRATPTVEGAGVRLNRVFGYPQVPRFDPFLLLDDFHSTDPKDYIAGFPRHPHRGIETVTYMLHGMVEHGDSMGNRGTITDGDIQWMTAGSGIIHQEMPRPVEGGLWGFQLWVNLPASHKMMEPRYQDIPAVRIPELRPAPGVKVRVICGRLGEAVGPVLDIMVDPRYLDIELGPDVSYELEVAREHTVFGYVVRGAASFSEPSGPATPAGSVVLLGPGEAVRVRGGAEGGRLLLIGGRPLGEPVAWYGPIVMNTDEQLRLAFEEYQNGTFIKSKGRVER